MSEEVQAIEPKSLNLFQKLWEKIPATWPHFFWSLLWAFLLTHPVAILLMYFILFKNCNEHFSSIPCVQVNFYLLLLPVIFPIAVYIKILSKSCSRQALFKSGLAFLLILFLALTSFVSSSAFCFMFYMLIIK
jgi:ABC-type sugar transport system permease subunit